MIVDRSFQLLPQLLQLHFQVLQIRIMVPPQSLGYLLVVLSELNFQCRRYIVDLRQAILQQPHLVRRLPRIVLIQLAS